MTAAQNPPWPRESRFLQTGNLLIDLYHRRAILGGVKLDLPQRLFDLLLLLLAEPYTLHSRAELLERLWPGLIVEDANLSQSMWLLRKALGDEQKLWIHTFAKRGYIFNPPAPIEWFLARPADAGGSPSVDTLIPTTSAHPPPPLEPNLASPEISSSDDFVEAIVTEQHLIPAPSIARHDSTWYARHVAMATDMSPPLETLIPNISANSPAALESSLTPSESLNLKDSVEAAVPERELVPTPSIVRRGFTWHARHTAIATGMVTLALLVIWLFYLVSSLFEYAPKTAAPAKRPQTVILIDLEDRANLMQWPAKLFRERLGWKLGSLPEVTLLSEADLATSGSEQIPISIFLSSGAVSNDPSQAWMRAHFQVDGQEHRFELQAPVSQISTLADQMSRKVMAQFVPERPQTWPPLAADTPTALRYADAVDAIEHRDWIAVSAIASEIVKQAPEFGLARIQLARAQSHLNQTASAVEQMNAARELLQPAPADVLELMRARTAAMDPQHLPQASAAFSELLDAHPLKTEYLLERARLLRQNDAPQEPLKILSDPVWDQRPPLETRIERLLSLSAVHQNLGDYERSRQSARAAEYLAHNAGAGWELERGRAMLLLAQADTEQFGERADNKQYELAARLLEIGGDRTATLFARFLADLDISPDGDSVARHQLLLAQVRTAGNRRLEGLVMRHIATHNFDAGDLPTYRRELEETLIVARGTGDSLMASRITLSLIRANIHSAQLDSADANIRQLRRLDLQGDARVDLERMAAELHTVHGRYTAAVSALERADDYLAKLQPNPIALARNACSRADPRQQLGDLAGNQTHREELIVRSGMRGVTFPSLDLTRAEADIPA
ncbi:winged helix-turn-helix domain-containing protein [Lysobacter antibioticus]|uniref:winged helix-turn-helix domain-containing protein n=1 Tax=Lysobacter antibioticus TaxID=84531 RepID=UPI0009E0507E|nr:winged helix-turn-helix domain-containing protein [Lysobacter antibioticus]